MSEKKAYPITTAVVQQRTEAATRHGATSKSRIRAVARAHKRRFLRQSGLRIADLDGIALGLIENWARAESKVSILDEFYAERGLVHGGEVDPSLRTYFTGVNSARAALSKLADYLKDSDASRGETLEAYVEATYGNGEG
jgi:hypothetical protein